MQPWEAKTVDAAQAPDYCACGEAQKMRILTVVWLAIAAVVLAGTGPSSAKLRFVAQDLEDQTFILVEGEFSHNDDLREFSRLVESHDPAFVTFDSAGGNVMKALELGRLIRAAGLATLQIRRLDCASACAFAFLGGVERSATPGSIGVHKMSLSGAPAAQIDGDTLARSIQEMTRILMAYMREMGTDPALIELALSYDSNDIGYLSGAEMERYRVVTTAPPTQSPQRATTPQEAEARPAQRPTPEPTPPPERKPPPRAEASSPTYIPIARSGIVRHPKGLIGLRSRPDDRAPGSAMLRNGTSVQIFSNANRWYGVRVAGKTGYLHHSWVYVDQFMQASFNDRYIQIKSFDNYVDAADYVYVSDLPLAAILATNGWYAITLDGTLPPAQAARMLDRLKRDRLVPADSFITFGNTYARRVCCN